MTAVEKREYYAQYKGKGRYVPPDTVETRIRDEYEIDPKQNEGAKFQFHDVKRRKADRQKMHGTDCECCRDYYEAVGPLPKYNQGPKWRDSSDEEDDRTTDTALREHQNKVSRHRETWKRNPTPPGYWEIGFPSTQKAEEQNAIADEMNKERARQLKQEVERKDSRWRKKK
ncbi:DNA repair protein endonuclease SAE2/CtIP C-terminus-domain-containing protein [Kockovaella imperatae]|uniref:DNA repair protein endonuclease SAE2/CtIP C-terminus-domain-containing protein n=1 Tax=Kockovaella imperatae TaxID=4999 RepID=A0A1Y1USP2_9TREE|nr:DNA repair protein endonuclease SAE2/CtIP C-terminus-domain-containing protein [Kockovaella imperatae]ORX40544.1 DNA repair protein endonuclease SAE2/CtIP C-terminus-domain-containing protein [Kockovaella imperatae]